MSKELIGVFRGKPDHLISCSESDTHADYKYDQRVELSQSKNQYV